MRTERTTLIYWVAAAPAMGSSTAITADDWVKLAPLANNSGSLYLDKDSIERNASGIVRATTRDVYDALHKLSDDRAYQCDTHTSVYNCKEGRTLPVSALIQDSQHGTVLAKTIDDPRQEAVVSRSEGEAILRIVCQKQRADDDVTERPPPAQGRRTTCHPCPCA